MGTEQQAGPPEGRLSAEMARHAVFPRVYWGGLSEESVGSFVRQAAAEIEKLTAEREHARSEAAMMSREIEALQANAARPPEFPQVMAAPDQAVLILRRAQATADQHVANGQVTSRQLVEDAQRQRLALLADGRGKATQIIEQAVAEAGREAGRVAAQAPVDAQRRLAYYTSLAESAQTGFAAWLKSLQAQVERWSTAEHAGAGAMEPERPQAPPPA